MCAFVETDQTDDRTRETKRIFAREQLQFLRDKGIIDHLRLSRIFKAAGPGQIREAWKLAQSDTDKIGIDVMGCIFLGILQRVKLRPNFGWERAKDVIRECGLYEPDAHNAGCFFRVLQGALEILIPGAHEFTPEELGEIVRKKEG